MRLNVSTPHRRQLISLTPLIDIVFILLLFFMLSSSFTQWNQINLSSGRAGEQTEQHISVIKLLNARGDFKVANTHYQMQDMSALRVLVAQESESVFVVETVPGIPSQTLISLLDQLKSAGAQQVSVAGVIP